MTPLPRLRIRDLRVRGVLVPLRLPLQTSVGTVTTAPLALIDLFTDEGVTGSTYLFCYTPLALKPVMQMLANLLPLMVGAAVAPADLDRKFQRQFRLLGNKGVVAMALAGLDMAAWDALARAQAVPLVRLLGGTPRPIPAYNSCGLGIMGAQRVAAEAEQLARAGLPAMKVRLGYDDATTDVQVVRAVRSAVGDGPLLMSDYNQALSVAEAKHRLAALAGEGLQWVEEPTLADDHAGHAALRRGSSVRIQMGENWWGPLEMAKCLAEGGSDLCMPDAMKIGGVTGWMRAAALADSAGLPMSSHLFPEISAHLLAVTPTCHWLEYVDWADPILQDTLRLEQGHALANDSPGTGIAWDEDAVARYLAP
ncbi:enolase C-terminal domain-like protein [Ideonella sp. A 288]|uniref:enolase C-terminal domain-like protein n=1 Tax=Ideonella sp. A 288 TaxID=1962181 RepID=UPI000B4B298A|nr:enolase C-terminal domain-like protein [Ideonella sp. A 288]